MTILSEHKLYKSLNGEIVSYEIVIEAEGLVHEGSDFFVTVTYRGTVVNHRKHFPTLDKAQQFVNNKVKERMLNGYRETKADAKGFVDSRVMLLKSVKPEDIGKLWAKLNSPFLIVQPKLNGLRATLDASGFWSRDENRFSKLDPLDYLQEFDPSHRLDGELYAKGYTLEEIMSMVKGDAPKDDLRFYAFDIMVSDIPYVDRLASLAPFTSDKIKVISSKPVYSVAELDEYFKWAVEEMQFEGIVIKKPFSYYEFGKRSSNLYKMKPPIFCTFPVVSYRYDTKGHVVFTCAVQQPLNQGNLYFDVVPAWSHKDRSKGREGYFKKVKYMRCRFFEWTKAGLPRHATGMEAFY